MTSTAVAIVLLGQLASTARATTPEAPISVLFATNSAEIDALTFGEMLRMLDDWQRNKPKVRYFIECYADKVGSDDYNMALSERRCETVRDALIEGGIPSDRIEMLAHGERESIVPTKDDAAEQANRTAIITWKWD
jgi:OmpA-OmpF porin, OOP family